MGNAKSCLPIKRTKQRDRAKSHEQTLEWVEQSDFLNGSNPPLAPIPEVQAEAEMAQTDATHSLSPSSDSVPGRQQTVNLVCHKVEEKMSPINALPNNTDLQPVLISQLEDNDGCETSQEESNDQASELKSTIVKNSEKEELSSSGNSNSTPRLQGSFENDAECEVPSDLYRGNSNDVPILEASECESDGYITAYEVCSSEASTSRLDNNAEQRTDSDPDDATPKISFMRGDDGETMFETPKMNLTTNEFSDAKDKAAHLRILLERSTPCEYSPSPVMVQYDSHDQRPCQPLPPEFEQLKFTPSLEIVMDRKGRIDRHRLQRFMEQRERKIEE